MTDGSLGCSVDGSPADIVRPVLSWALCILATLMLVVCILLLASGTIVRFEAIFRDLNIKLPLLTCWVIGFARWHGWAVLAAAAAGGVWLQVPYAGRTWKIIADAVGLVLAMALLAMIVAGLFAPLISIIDQLAGQPPQRP